MRENYLAILLAGGFVVVVSLNAVFLGKAQAHSVQPRPIMQKKLIKSRTSTKKVYWDEEEKLIREIEVFHLLT